MSRLILPALFAAAILFASAVTALAGAQDHNSHSARPEYLHTSTGRALTVRIRVEPGSFNAGKPVKLYLSPVDRSGEPVRDLEISHERILHVIIISADFRHFAHLHPEDFGTITQEVRKEAEYMVGYAFPEPGVYLVAADFASKGEHYSAHHYLHVGGTPEMDAPDTGLSRTWEEDGYKVVLSGPEHIKAGDESRFLFRIEKDGRPVTDLQQYLAAPMHLAIVLADLKQFIHAHGEVPGQEHTEHVGSHIHGHAPVNFGPELAATIKFPARGVYKIFGEFKNKGKVLTSEFTVLAE